MTASTLLAALIAASSATNGVITVGDTQPFDQVRLYQNPANDTVLTNQSSDGSIDTSSTALVITGSTAPTGLVFEPNLAVLRNVTSDIKLLVDTPVELTLTVNLAGSLTEMTVEAGKTAVLTLGLIAGIPMIVGAFGFFPLASPSDNAWAGLHLVNAVYADGALQYTGGQVEGLSTNSMFARMSLALNQTVNITLPSQPYAITAVLSTASEYLQALAQASAMVTIFDDLANLSGYSGLSVAAGDQIGFVRMGQFGDVLGVQFNGGEPYPSPADSLIGGTKPVYLFVFVTNHFNESPIVPVIPLSLITAAEPVAEQ